MLTAKNESVSEINDYMMNTLDGPSMECLSSYSICKASSNVPNQNILYPIEFLNSLKFMSRPNHVLHLKKGVLVMLFRNFNQSSGFCNDKKMVITHLEKWSVQAKIVFGTHIGDVVYILRITMTTSKSK